MRWSGSELPLPDWSAKQKVQLKRRWKRRSLLCSSPNSLTHTLREKLPSTLRTPLPSLVSPLSLSFSLLPTLFASLEYLLNPKAKERDARNPKEREGTNGISDQFFPCHYSTLTRKDRRERGRQSGRQVRLGQGEKKKWERKRGKEEVREEEGKRSERGRGEESERARKDGSREFSSLSILPFTYGTKRSCWVNFPEAWKIS